MSTGPKRLVDTTAGTTMEVPTRATGETMTESVRTGKASAGSRTRDPGLRGGARCGWTNLSMLPRAQPPLIRLWSPVRAALGPWKRRSPHSGP